MKRKRPNKRLSAALVFVLLVAVICTICQQNISPYIENRAEYGAQNAACAIIGKTVYSVLENGNNNYDDFATVIYDESGKVCSVEILSGNLSKMQSQISSEIYYALKEIEDSEISVSLGDISGFFMLFGRGIDIDVKIDSVGSVFCDVESEFTQAGVNQTCHSIYFDISVDITVIFPFECVETSVCARYLAAQTVIVGNVPQLYA